MVTILSPDNEELEIIEVCGVALVVRGGTLQTLDAAEFLREMTAAAHSHPGEPGLVVDLAGTLRWRPAGAPEFGGLVTLADFCFEIFGIRPDKGLAIRRSPGVSA